jgi:membrane-bound ClpP family serine protease
MRYVPRIGWVARYGLAVYVSYYIGVEFTRKIPGEVMPQMARTIQPLNQWSFASLSAFLTSPSFLSLLAIVGTYSVLVYFFFSREQGPVTKRISRVGVWFLMVSFGAAFGFTVMGRVALLIGRLNFLLLDWLYPTLGI